MTTHMGETKMRVGSQAVVRKRWLPAISLLGILYAANSCALPIEYSLTVPSATVTLAGVLYSNVTVQFILDGDDATVISGTAPGFPPGIGASVSYSANFIGSASVLVASAGVVIETAKFSPNQIAVSVDHTNIGIGFGFVPQGVGAGGFDVNSFQPLYPAAISAYELFVGTYFPNPPFQTEGWGAYDLTLAFAKAHTQWPVDTYYFSSAVNIAPFNADGSATIFNAAYSCYQFGGSLSGTCGTPVTLQTDLGEFTINTISEPNTIGELQTPMTIGHFAARPIVPAHHRHRHRGEPMDSNEGEGNERE